MRNHSFPVRLENSKVSSKHTGYINFRWQQRQPKLPLSSDASLIQSAQACEKCPLVSVIIPAYNAEAFIARTLESVIAQTYRNLEILVIDDGSSDRTASIVREFMQRDRRISLIQQANAGVAAARNLGIQRTTGELIAPLDADDTWYPCNIEKQVQAMMHGGPAVGLVYSWSIDIDEQDQPIEGIRASSIAGWTYKTLICHNFIGNASASMIRRSCLDRVGLYDVGLHNRQAQGCEDWDLYLRIAEAYEFRVVPKFLVGYRKSAQTMSGNFHQMAKSHMLVMQAAKMRSPNVPSILYRLSSSSFYMYLARQSFQYGNHTYTLYWLRQALKADCLTPVLRLGFYQMLFRSYVAILQTNSGFQQSDCSALAVQGEAYSQSQIVKSQSSPPHSFKKNSFRLQFKLAIGSFLHQVLQFI